jgi:anthranilate synthase component 1
MRSGLLVEPVSLEGALGSASGRALNPEALLLALEAANPDADGLVWLDSGIGAGEGRSLLGVGTRVPLREGQPVLPALRAALAALPALMPAAAADAESDVVPLGLVGWFGYELRGETMGMPVPPVPGHRRAAWLRVDRGVLIDHATGKASLVALEESGAGGTPGHETPGQETPGQETPGEWSGELAEWRDGMLALVSRVGAASLPPVGEAAPTHARWRDDDDRYAELVRRCQGAIREGEAYQLCLTTSATIEGDHDPIEVYRRLRRGSPAHHGAFVRIGGTTLLSASPETFLRVAHGTVQTRPIKGTRRRDPDPERDAALAAELAASDKEQAENLMIVDLMRNDLSRVCELGSVAVTGLLEVESYAHVHQLVSTVQGRLRAGLDVLDAVAACLPAGSMTGAPKRRAVELLESWEDGPRGVYSGAFGYLGADGSADLAMVIRSILIEGDTATIGAGGGVTALSEPEAETAEMHLKAEALLRVLGAHAQPVP